MPQEAWVLQCCSCKIYQTQLKKKAKKWQCKVCGKKQEFIKIHFKGPPQQCRIHVQNSNMARGTALENKDQDDFQNGKQNQDEEQYEQNEQYDQNEQEEHYLQKLSVQYREETYEEQSAYFYNATIDKEYQEFVEPINSKNWSSQLDCDISYNIKSNYDSGKLSSYSATGSVQLKTINSEVNTECNENKENNEVFEDSHFDINELILEASKKNERRSKANFVPKLSIFESNCDIDESLDF